MVNFLTESESRVSFDDLILVHFVPVRVHHFPTHQYTYTITTMGGMHIIWVGIVVAAIAIVAWFVTPKGKNQV